MMIAPAAAVRNTRNAAGSNDYLPMVLMLVLLSAVLCWAAFPPLNAWPLAWGGLVPLFFALSRLTSRRAAFGLAYLAGLLFFISTLWWIGYVTVPGMLLLCVYLALFWGMFGVVFLMSRHLVLWQRLLFLPSVWVILEQIREHAFTGFGWSALAHTQALNTVVIQIADITGAAGVSFLIVAVNVLLAEAWTRLLNKVVFDVPFRRTACGVFFVVVIVVGYGIFRVTEDRSIGTLKIGAVQGNATLTESWAPSMKPVVVERYLTLTRQVLDEKPDLVVWPETAFPQFYWEYPELMEEVRGLVRESNVPLLFGTVTREENEYFNSAILLTPPDGHESGRYSKQHLVVFGEYIPFRREMPFLADIVPIDDFTAGRDKTVFLLKGGMRFGVLICFEDTVARLSREAVLGGSQFLVNITNDAWFKDSPGLRMQVYNALFRAVENRRSLLRVTNTGVSCLINPNGSVGACIEDAQKKQVLIEGVMAPVVPLGTDISFYTKFPQAFTFLCFLIILGVSVPLLRSGCRQQKC